MLSDHLRFQDIVSILRVYLIDPSPEVVIPLISKFQQFITHMHSEIHMVVEALVRLLVGLLGRRQRPIRAGAIRVGLYLAAADDDRAFDSWLRWTETEMELS